MDNILTQIRQMKQRGELTEKFIRSGGKGGQNVNKVSTCVYLKHLPTGIEIKMESSRTQGSNRKAAYALMINKIKELYADKLKKEIHLTEKDNRKNRKKPKRLKERILSDKKYQSEKKTNRAKIII